VPYVLCLRFFQQGRTELARLYRQRLAGILALCRGADSGTSGYDGDDSHGEDGNIAILDNAYNKVTIEHCTIRESAGYGIIRGWSTSTHGAGPDYTSSSYYNNFSNNNWGDQSPPRS